MADTADIAEVVTDLVADLALFMHCLGDLLVHQVNGIDGHIDLFENGHRGEGLLLSRLCLLVATENGRDDLLRSLLQLLDDGLDLADGLLGAMS